MKKNGVLSKVNNKIYMILISFEICSKINKKSQNKYKMINIHLNLKSLRKVNKFLKIYSKNLLKDLLLVIYKRIKRWKKFDNKYKTN